MSRPLEAKEPGIRFDVKRLVFHLAGYDPMTPEAAYRRFARELRRFEGTWSAAASLSERDMRDDAAIWRVVASGPNWRVETEYRLVRWDDVIAAASRRPMWLRIALGLGAFWDFLAAGAASAYLRANWRYAVFFLYPFLLFMLFVAAAAAAGVFTARAVGSSLAGVVTGALALAVLVRWPGRRFYLPLLFDDWIFSRRYIRRGDPVLDARLDRLARDLAAAARDRVADEIVIVGHSLGAVLAIDLVDRALRHDPMLGQAGPRVALLSIGSSILKIGLHRSATRLRAAVARVAAAPGVFWAEYQAINDIMNFYKSDPAAALGLSAMRAPLVRIVRFSDMLDPVAYRWIRRRFFRLHNQFVSANDRRYFYDYFMLLCGPLFVEQQVRAAYGAGETIAADGTLVHVPPAGPARARPAWPGEVAAGSPTASVDGGSSEPVPSSTTRDVP